MRDETRVQDPGSGDSGGGKKLDTTVPQAADEIPQSKRPWSGRPDAAQLEERFRRDRAGWRRRINAARRRSYDASDELVAPSGRWTT
jgi:uncharacterized protein (DUF4415 family)